MINMSNFGEGGIRVGILESYEIIILKGWGILANVK